MVLRLPLLQYLQPSCAIRSFPGYKNRRSFTASDAPYFPMKTLGLARRFGAEHDGQKLATAPKSIQRFGVIALCRERAHKPAIQRLGQIVSFQSAPIQIDGRGPIPRGIR